MTEYQKSKIHELRFKGMGYKAIGNILGLHRDVVRYYCRKNGLDGDGITVSRNYEIKKDKGIICLYCGTVLKHTSLGRRRKFCTEECRRKWWKENADKGKTPSSIATFLTESNIPTPAGKKIWQASTVESILTNEKYKGDALLQKTFTVDFLTKKKKINEGEIQQYYIEGSHPAIIPPEFFDLVQIEFTKRKGQKRSTSGVFASMLVCGDCGNYYGSKVWHSNTKYRRTIWQCNHKFKNKTKCSTPHLTEEQLKEAFVNMFNSTVANRDELTEGILDIISEISNTDNIDAKLSILYKELEASAEQIRLWVEENAHRAMSQIKYEAEYAKRTEVYKRVNEKISELEKEKLIKKNKYKEAKTALSILKENNTPIQEFDSGLFFGLIEKIIVHPNKNLIFTFKDGTKVNWSM